MKKIYISMGVLLLLTMFSQCGKKTNNETLSAPESQADSFHLQYAKNLHVYSGADGLEYKVLFFSQDGKELAKIEGKDFAPVLLTAVQGNEGLYAAEGYKFQKPKDQQAAAKWERNGEQILLALLSPLSVVYVDDGGKSIRVTYINQEEKKEVVIELNQKEIVLPQKEAWAKGGVYQNDSISWSTQGDKATLQEGDKKTVFKVASR